MKTLILFAVALVGCSHQAVNSTKKVEPSTPVSAKGQTMADWVAEQNNKKEKCNGGLEAGTNGYDYWNAECVNGVLVYRDTTEESLKWIAEIQDKKDALISAARSRILTPKETKQLLDYGPQIFTRQMEQYSQEDIERSFDELLLQQARLKAIGK